MRARRILYSILLYLAASLAFAASPLYEKILLSTHEELVDMAALRGIDTSLSDNELRTALYDAEGIVARKGDLSGDEDGDYTLNIIAADSIETLPDGSILLKGNVEISFLLKGDEKPRTLITKNLLVESGAKKLTAFGQVHYRDESLDKGLGDMDADIVTLLWEKGDLIVSGGTTYAERENSEGEKVNFYTSGKLLSYKGNDSGLFFRDGFITSNPKKQYSSIRAKEISFLEGGDMFLSSATLNIGRIPILYFPAFFYPGSRLVGNPAFGFASDRGMFLSTTWELLGSYPKFSETEESSFSALLRNKDQTKQRSNGVYYEEDLEASSPLAAWAEKSGSYITVLADSYEYTGFDAGTDSLLKLFEQKLTLSSHSLIAYSDEEYNDTNRRFYSINEFKYSSKRMNLTGYVPFYSDPYVLQDYGNRLTSFSIDSIFGMEQTFPSTYSSNITSYTSTINGSFDFPVKNIPFIDSLKLTSLKFASKSTWKSSKQEYEVSDITYPEMNLSVSGSLINITDSKEKDKVQIEEEEVEEVKLSDYFILSDEMLFPLYENEIKKTRTKNRSDSYFKLSYTAYEQYSRKYDEIDGDNFEGESTVSKAGGTVTMSGKHSDTFSFSSALTPNYTYTFYEESKNERTDILSFNSANTIEIPKLGFKWYLNAQLYRYKKVENDSSLTETEEHFGWDTESVKDHYISFSKTLDAGELEITPSVKYVLDPLSGIITPSLSLKYRKFTASFKWKIVEDEETEEYKGEDMNLSLGYLGTYFTSSLAALYESDEYTDEDFFYPLSFKSSASLRTRDKAYSITEYLNYDYEDDGVKNEIESLKTYIVTPVFKFTHNSKTIDEKLMMDYWEAQLGKSGIAQYWWKNRIMLSGSVNALFHYDYNNPYNIYSTLTTKLTYSVAEFIDINLSLVTKNNGYYRYNQDGNFFGNMFEDFKRSFDFMGSGVEKTQFIMDSVSLEVVHYMNDWDLHCKYSASVVSSSSGYTWVPTVTFYLRWKTLPDLKVDQNWKRYEGQWEKTDSVYGD